MTTKEKIDGYLDNLPSEWKKSIFDALCHILDNPVDCEQVKECETLTSLSPFTVDGSTVSIQYKDENGVTVTRSFDVATIVNGSLDDVDVSCFTEPSTWATLTYTERIQLIIDAHCTCCAI